MHKGKILNIFISALFFCTIYFNQGDLSFALDEQSIIPGKSMGSFILEEMKRSDVRSIKSRIDLVPLFFSYRKGRDLIEITTTSDYYMTEKGIRVGSSADDVINVYGKPRTDRLIPPNELVLLDSYIYDGILFMFRDNKVAAIRVFSSGLFDFIPTKNFQELTGYEFDFWDNRKNVRKIEPEKSLIEACLKDYKKIHPSYSVEYLSSFESIDNQFMFIGFQAEHSDKISFYYVYSLVDKEFLGRFYLDS